MADDEDVLGTPGRDDLFGPPGPRRSNFTPAPTDAESLEAANNVFNDDAIAAALAAELARVASGPISIVQQPTQPAAEPAAVSAPEPVVPAAAAPVDPAPIVSEPPAAPEPVAVQPVAPEPVAVETPAPEPIAAEPVSPEPAQQRPAPQAPTGPPDWASSLFGQPTPTVRDESPEPVRDPFAPNAPSFAPSSGPFPPPSETDAAADAGLTTDAEALRALYRGAPAPTVPPADAPPPPGYEATPINPPVQEAAPPEPPSTPPPPPVPPAATDPSPSLVAQLQDELHLQEQEAREFAVWESSMQAIGTPEALAEVARARQELASAPTPAAVPEPPAIAEPPAAVEPPAVAEPPVDPLAYLAQPSDVPSAPAPASESAFAPAPPEASPFPTLDPPTADFATSDGGSGDFATPDATTGNFASMDASPEWGTAEPVAEPEWEQQPNVYDVESPFPGFAPPTTEEPAQMFEAPADPRDLSFEQSPAVPDAPVFIEPPALIEPTAPSDGVQSLWEEANAAPPPPPVEQRPLNPLVPPQNSPPTPAPPPPPEPSPFAAFDSVIDAGQDAASSLPAPQWPSASEPPSAPGPDDESGDKRPFGEGVDRDDAVDPTDSIFALTPAPVSVNTAGVAVVPAPVTLDSRPVRIVSPQPDPDEPAPLVAPPVLPAEPVGLEPTPVEQRVGRSARLFWLWFAANSSIVAIVFGTIIFGLGVSLRQAIVATLAGVAVSFLPLGLGTLAGKRSGQPTMVISRATFGVIGNLLPALIALFSRLFWAAALLWILGSGIADILNGAKLTGGFTTSELTLIVMGLGFLVAVVLGYFGYRLISIVQLIISVVSGIAIVGFIALTVQYVNVSTALTVQDGPWILVVTGAVLVFSFVGLAWANSGADVARYQRTGSRGSAAMLWATFGAGLPSFVLICYGALLAASNPTLAHNIELDPLDSLGRLLPIWYPAPLIAATGLSLLSGVVLAMYSGGFALQATGLRVRRPLATLVLGLLVVLLAVFVSLSVTDYAQLVRDLATTVAVPVAAWAGLFGSELMLRRRRFHAPSLLERGGVYSDLRAGNLLALIVFSVIGFGFLSATLPGLEWEGFLLSPLGISPQSVVGESDFGVLVALGLGIIFPLVAGIPGIRKQEKAEGSPE